MVIDNPQWDRIQDLISQGVVTYVGDSRAIRAVPGKHSALLAAMVGTSPIIADPELVNFVAEVTSTDVVIPEAGSGYWAFLLKQHGKSVSAYGRKNFAGRVWHRVLRGSKSETEIRLNEKATLLLLSPADANTTVRYLNLYDGPRVVILGPDPRRFDAVQQALLPLQLAAYFPGVHKYEDPVYAWVFQRNGRATWDGNTMLMRAMSRRPT